MIFKSARVLNKKCGDHTSDKQRLKCDGLQNLSEQGLSIHLYSCSLQNIKSGTKPEQKTTTLHSNKTN